YFQIPANELNDRCELTQDTCIIDEKDFYIKGQLNIPVDNNDRFCWNVWVLISREDFLRSIELWHEENRFLEKPYEGKMATKLDCYPDTLNLDVLVYTQKIGITPEIEVIESTNPIFFEQQNGISMERVISFARQILYAH
ncbi:MAG: DUF2199 domain-containing protein, partial [Mucilaginibacter sp.]